MTDIALATTRRILILIWVVATVLIVSLTVAALVAPRLGWTLFAIRGASMEPAVPLGSLAIASPVDPGSIVVGDIISFQGGAGTVTTHRVSGIVDEGGALHFETHGDANQTPDPQLVQASAVVGRIDQYVPAIGYLQLYMSTPAGFISLLSSMGTLLLAIWMLEDAERSRRSRRARGAWPRSVSSKAPAVRQV